MELATEVSVLQNAFWLVLILYAGRTAGDSCPAADTSFGSCTGTQTISVDWTNYPTLVCPEVQIVIPENYPMASCTWLVEITNAPNTISPGITVNAVLNGDASVATNAADSADTIVITSDPSGNRNQEFSGSLADLYDTAGSVPVSMTTGGEAESVEISFTSQAAFTGAGFTLRVVLYAFDESTVCGSIDSPNTITLTENCNKAALATPNFPSNYPSGVSCYTNVVSPSGTQIKVEYLYIDLRTIQDNVLIFDTNPTPPCILRIETSGAATGTVLDQRAFESRTDRLQVAFVDTGAQQDPGVLLLFSTVDAFQPTVDCTTCDCSSVPSSTNSECEAATTNGFYDIANDGVTTPTEEACSAQLTLDWGQTDSYLFLATPGFNSAGYTSTDTCNWIITGPTNSNLVVIFKHFDITSLSTVFIAPGNSIGRIFRLTGDSPTVAYNDGSGAASLSIIDAEIIALSNRVTVGLLANSRDTVDVGLGASFEVRVVDNRCLPRCVNGGQCNCQCVSGYRGVRCNNPIPITLSVSPTSVTEGGAFEVVCTAMNPIIDGTSITLAVDTTSTATEGSDYDFPPVASNKCIIGTNGRSATATITTFDDAVLEETEEIVLIVGDISTGGAPNAADGESVTITISDSGSDSTLTNVEFSNTLYEVNESDLTFTGTIEFKIDNTNYPIPQDGSIDLSYTLGTASSSDFSQITTVSFDQSMSPLTSTVLFEIPITDDSDVENTEIFTIFLTVPTTTPQLLGTGAVTSATVWILDNDYVDNIVIIDNPEIDINSNKDVHLFAFTSSYSSMTWSTEDTVRPKFTREDLVIDGTTCGQTLTFDRSNWRPQRRIGRYTVTLGSNDPINAVVRVDSDCLNLSGNWSKTAYPSSTDNSQLSSSVTLTVPSATQSKTCPTDIKWQKDGNDISVPGNGRSYTVSTRAAADGVFTSYRRNRLNKGWFVMTEVIVSDCPENTYKDNSGLCTLTCPNCRNGGVCQLDGTCLCPPCFTGSLCEIKQSQAGTFGTGKRVQCSTLHSDVANRTNCEGFLFCYGGLYGCTCGCGWMGRSCTEACSDGKYGPDCSQECGNSCTISECDPFTGCP